MTMNKRMILSMAGFSLALYSLGAAEAASYKKQTANQPGEVTVDVLTLVATTGNQTSHQVRLLALDPMALHVGQKFRVAGLSNSVGGVEDGVFAFSSQKLVLPKVLVEQQPHYNLTMQLTQTEPEAQLTLTGMGLVGAPGAKGDKGDTGAQGPKGDKGDTGAQGAKGDKGDSGAQGAKGDKGDTGAQGLRGDTGATGPQGPVGPQGFTGADGLTTSVNGVAQVGGNVTLTKANIGLANVDNTSDANKPISTATQTALNLKAPLASPALTGTPTAPTPGRSDNSTKIATTEFVQNNLHQSHTLGEAFGGGVVIYIAEGSNGEHGLITTNDEMPLTHNWYSAVSRSREISRLLDPESRKYTDWRLPYFDELGHICVNQSVLANPVNTTAGAANEYWSADADASVVGSASTMHMTGCNLGFDRLKSEIHRVRLVRSF